MTNYGPTGVPLGKRREARGQWQTMSNWGVECDRHNSRPIRVGSELERARRLAEALDVAARLTTAETRHHYVKIRALWLDWESRRRRLELEAAERARRAQLVLTTRP